MNRLLTVAACALMGIGCFGGIGEVVRTIYPTDDLVVAERVLGPAENTGEDMSAKMQAALDEVGRQGGGTLFLRAGRYTLAKPIELPIGVTLRGDYSGGRDGTVLCIIGGCGEEDGTAAISMNPGSGLVGLVFWYPDQRLDHPRPYPWTVRTALKPKTAADNQTIVNCTFVNAWRAIAIGPEWNELHTFRKLRICALKTGLAVDFTTDIGRVSEVTISPRVWSESGFSHSPSLATLGGWLRVHGAIGADYGRSDWEFIWRLRVDGYAKGLRFRKGSKGLTNAVVADSDLVDCQVALEAEALNEVGLAVYDSRLAGDEESLRLGKDFKSVIQLHSCQVKGTVPQKMGTDPSQAGTVPLDKMGTDPSQAGTVPQRWGVVEMGTVPLRMGTDPSDKMGTGPSQKGTVPTDTVRPEPLKWERKFDQGFFNVVNFGASAGLSDNSGAFQRALDAARNDGGTVYVPAGYYRFRHGLKVPKGVELRGCSGVPHHTCSGGSVLMPYQGRGDEQGEPFVQLEPGSGLRGLAFWYPEETTINPVPYPWTIRALGANCHLRDVNIGNGWQGADFASFPSDGHRISYLSGCCWRHALAVGNCRTRGWVEDLQFNPHYSLRRAHGLPVAKNPPVPAGKPPAAGWESGFLREHLEGFVFRDCADEQIRGTFLYAARDGIAFYGLNHAAMLIHGTDTGSRGVVLKQRVGGSVSAALTQLVPFDSAAKVEKGAIMALEGDEGRSVFRASQFWVNKPTMIQRGRGEVALEEFNSLSGPIFHHSGSIQVENGVFPHLRGPRIQRCRE